MNTSLEDAIRRGWRNDGSLPLGWECLQDESSSKPFFVDHNTQSTTWVDPRDYLRKPHTFEECVGEELPFGWEEAVDAEVGVYFINHNEWTTQLDDPRLYSTSNRHKKEFTSFLKDTDTRVRYLRERARDIEANLKRTHQELGALHSQRRLARMHGDVRDPALDRSIRAKEVDIRGLEEELAQVQKEMEALLRGMDDLEGIRKRNDHPITVDEAKDKMQELRIIHDLSSSRSKERMALEEALLDSGADYTLKFNSALQRELNALRLQQQQQLESIRAEYEKLLQSQRTVHQQQLNNTNNTTSTTGMRTAPAAAAPAVDPSLRDLVHFKQEEKMQLELAIKKMKELVGIHETQARRLAERVEDLERENHQQRHRLEHVQQLRQREQDVLQTYVQQGRDMSFLDSYVSKAQLADQLNQLRNMREEDKRDLWREMEATSDIFMPKTKLEAILNSHESQLDELRRLLSARPTERVVVRRVWNENLQTFEEVGPRSTSSVATAPSAAIPATYPTATTATTAAAAGMHYPHAPPMPQPPTRPKSGLELEMDLAAARKEYERLERDIMQLKAVRNSLAAAEDDNVREAVKTALGPMASGFNSSRRVDYSASGAPTFVAPAPMPARLPSAPAPAAAAERGFSSSLPPAASAGGGVRAQGVGAGSSAFQDRFNAAASMGTAHPLPHGYPSGAGAGLAGAVASSMPPAMTVKPAQPQGHDMAVGGLGDGAELAASFSTKMSMGEGATGGRATARKVMADADYDTDDLPDSAAGGFSRGASSRSAGSRRGMEIQTPVFMAAPPSSGFRGTLSPVNAVDSEMLLAGEDWMLNPRVLDMLQVREDSRQRIAKLREDAQTKVVELREKARSHPSKMTFADKMAYFTTAGADIHRDIQRRGSETAAGLVSE